MWFGGVVMWTWLCGLTLVVSLVVWLWCGGAVVMWNWFCGVIGGGGRVMWNWMWCGCVVL